MANAVGIMDDYLGGLEKHDQMLIKHVFAPFQFTPGVLEADRAEEARLLKQEVTIGASTFVVSGRNEEELQHHAEKIIARADSIKASIEGIEPDEEFLPEEDTCTLPTIAELRDLHKNYPVFGILVCAHDIQCEYCETPYHTEDEQCDELLEDGKTPEQTIAALSDQDQLVLIALARRFLDDLHRRIRPSERLSLRVKEDVQLLEALDELDWLPSLAYAYTKESFLWMITNHYFCRDTLLYADASEKLLETFWKFEADLVLQLPFDIQKMYEQSASMLCGADTTEFFAKIENTEED